MKKTMVTLAATALLFAGLSSFVESERKEKYNNPASQNNLAKRVYEDISHGRTDSLFLHLTEIYGHAGWKNYVPFYNEERAPILIQQDYRVPFSKCSGNEITQSRLMDSLSQGWKYWQMWSDSLTNSTWKPSASIKDEQEAYLLGNYTILVIMSHELGHFYANGNGADESGDGMRENVADHFAMAMLLDLTKADKRFAKLLERFRKVFIHDIYSAVPGEERSSICEGYTLYEHVAFLRMKTSFKEYATMQLVRENIILDLPGLNLYGCLETYRQGLRQAINGNKIRQYTDSVKVTYFREGMTDIGSKQIEIMNEVYFGLSSAIVGVYPDGELYGCEKDGSTVTLTSLTNSYGEKKYDLAPLKSQLDSIAGFDINGRANKRKFVFVFDDTANISVYFIGQHANGKQLIRRVDLLAEKQLNVVRTTGFYIDMENGLAYLYFCSRSDKGIVFTGYDALDRGLILLPADPESYSVIIPQKNMDLLELPDDRKELSFPWTFGINYAADPNGNLLFAKYSTIEYRRAGLYYTVFIECGTERRGFNTGLHDSTVWSQKYGFVGAGNYNSDACVVGMRFH